MPDMQEVGLRILVCRRRAGMNQTALAKAAKISQKQLSLLEAGKAPGVKAVTIARLALALKTTTDYLLGLAEEPDSEDEPASTALVGA